MVYGHPLSSIQHPLEDPGIHIYIYMSVCDVCVFGRAKKQLVMTSPAENGPVATLSSICQPDRIHPRKRMNVAY